MTEKCKAYESHACMCPLPPGHAGPHKCGACGREFGTRTNALSLRGATSDADVPKPPRDREGDAEDEALARRLTRKAPPAAPPRAPDAPERRPARGKPVVPLEAPEDDEDDE